MKKTHLFWQGREYESLENCIVNENGDGISVDSVIVGLYQKKSYRVAYSIRADADWNVISCDIGCIINGVAKNFRFENDNGNWKLGGKTATELYGCAYVDIPLTPFTNTLPVNHLKMAIGVEQVVKIVYIDLLEDTISAVEQKYVRLSENTYHYENIPNDFEADIEVDDSGFVVDYPQLFVRKAAF